MKNVVNQSQIIHAFIICWTGKEDSARHIANSIQSSVEYLTIIYSNTTGKIEEGAGKWFKVPNEWYSGKKFQKCLQLYSGTIMLYIAADVTTNNWPRLINRCRNTHAQYKNLGIWAPDIDYTPYNSKRVIIANIKESQFALVSNTDSIVWSLSNPVVRRLKELDYECNNLGWGIDWLAISYALANNLLVIRDLSIKIIHPKGTGYDQPLAQKQMTIFLNQLTNREKLLLSWLDTFTCRGTQQTLKTRLKCLLLKMLVHFQFLGRSVRMIIPEKNG